MSLFKLVLQDATPLDESPYPSYLVMLTGAQILDFMNNRYVDIDPLHQRGKTAATKTKQSQVVHSLKKNRDHIQGLVDDLRTITSEYGRNAAVFPPIWMNARRDDNNSPRVEYNLETKEIAISTQLLVVDGWHRSLAIKEAAREGLIKPDRKFMCCITDSPLGWEAVEFRKLNAAGMPVLPARIAWVSAPHETSWHRAAYEFATRNWYFHQNGEYNFETIKSNISSSSSFYCSFLAIANGFASSPNITSSLWDDGSLIPTNASHMELVVEFMNGFWNYVVAVRPELGFLNHQDRAQTRQDVPLLVNNLMAQCLVWCGPQLVRSMATSVTSMKDRLLELKAHPDRMSSLFKHLTRLATKHNGLDLFSSKSPIFQTYLNTRGTWERNDFGMRKDVFNRLITTLGIDKPNSVVIVTKKNLVLKQEFSS